MRIHVVEIGFDDGNLFVETGNGFFGHFADHNADNIGLAFKIGRARTVANSGDAHRRLRAERIAKSGNDGRAGRCDEFPLHAVGICWLALQQVGSGRRGNGQNAVGHFGGPAADVQSGAGKFLNTEGVETDACPNNVHNSVDGTHFVKMNFLDGDIVYAGFCFTELDEDFCSVVANVRR